MVRIAMTLAFAASVAWAQAGTIVREGAEQAGKFLLKEAAGEGADAAARVAGKEMAELLGEAGLRWLARTGAGGAHVAERYAPALVKAFGRVTEEGLEACARHGDLALKVGAQLGEEGLEATAKLSGRSARRLSMLSGEIKASGRAADAVKTVRKGADGAVDLLWRHKGKLALLAAAGFVAYETDAVRESFFPSPGSGRAPFGAPPDWTRVWTAAALALCGVTLLLGWRVTGWFRPARRAATSSE